MNRTLLPLLASFALAAAALTACADSSDAPETPEDEAPRRVVDSVFPPEEQIRRFQATVTDTPTALFGAADTRDALVERFLAAAELRSPDSLLALAMTKGEFAFLYYPNSRFAAPPYQLAPEVLWFQIRNSESRGVTRLLRQLEERRMDVLGYECEEAPVGSSTVRIWEDCFALLPGDTVDTVRLRLFGSIVEHDGAFKFLSLSNDL